MSDDGNKPFFDVTASENMVVGHIDGVEIFRLTFNPTHFAENLHRTVPPPAPAESAKEKFRSALKEINPGCSDEEIERASELAAAERMRRVFAAKAQHIAAQISANLDGLLLALMEDVIRAYAIQGTVDLNKEAGRTVDIRQYKDAILQQQWARIRDLAGIKHGGGR